MKKQKGLLSLLPVYILVLGGLFIVGIGGNGAITVFSENVPVENRKCVVIDAGHGGEDGGAVSCTGVSESHINLQIALRLNDMLNLLGIDTAMIRDGDYSVYTQGDSIAAKKISDLKERVRIVNNTPNAFLVSIHQNHFSEARYKGGQVFYSGTNGSRSLAAIIQEHYIATLNPGSNRQIKRADSVYLMEQIQCTGVLIECGFLSNPQEESMLRNERYQKNICCVIASSLSTYLSNT